MINARCEGAAQTAGKWLGTREGQGRDRMHSRGPPPSTPPKPPPSVQASPTRRDAGGGDSGKLRQGVSPWLAVGAAGRRQVSACVTLQLPRGGVGGKGCQGGRRRRREERSQGLLAWQEGQGTWGHPPPSLPRFGAGGPGQLGGWLRDPWARLQYRRPPQPDSPPKAHEQRGHGTHHAPS